jgi:hypothetical protein
VTGAAHSIGAGYATVPADKDIEDAEKLAKI